MPASLQVHCLFECAQAETPTRLFERDARHVQRAVAVSLVLHHGEQFYMSRQVAADEPHIVSQPREVNLHPSRPERKNGRIKIRRAGRVGNRRLVCGLAPL